MRRTVRITSGILHPISLRMQAKVQLWPSLYPNRSSLFFATSNLSKYLNQSSFPFLLRTRRDYLSSEITNQLVARSMQLYRCYSQEGASASSTKDQQQPDPILPEEEVFQPQEDQRGGANFFQRLLFYAVPLLLVFGIGKLWYTSREQFLSDDTLQVEMNAIMTQVFQKTVYHVLDNPTLRLRLGDPLLVEPTKVRFHATKDNAWIFYPLYTPRQQVCSVTVDLLHIDPTKAVDSVNKPHHWFVAQVEVDLNDGEKVLVSTEMDGVPKFFNIKTWWKKIWKEMQEEEQQMHAAART
jgi:hypothetical protein